MEDDLGLERREIEFASGEAMVNRSVDVLVRVLESDSKPIEPMALDIDIDVLVLVPASNGCNKRRCNRLALLVRRKRERNRLSIVFVRALITGFLHEASCFEVLNVVVGGSLWDTDLVDELGDRDRTMLEDVGVNPSECRRFEEIDDHLELLNGWLARPRRRLRHLDYELWIIHYTASGDEADESLSKFVQKCVKYAIEQSGPDFAELGKQAKRIQELETHVVELRNQIKQMAIVIEKLENDLRRARVEPFQEERYDGKRKYDQENIEVRLPVLSGATVSDTEIPVSV